MNFDVYFHHVFVLFKDKAGILMKQNKNGFTLMEMLIVIAIIAVLIAVAIPVFASQLEKAREATDLANVRSAYAQVSTEALLGNSEATVTVNLKQKQADWQSVDPVNIGGIVHSKSQGDTVNWIGVAEPNGTCVVSYKEDYGIILNWSGKADPSTPKYPFNTNVTDFFPLLYKTDFWQDMKNNTNFEFDSRCPDSQYVPSIITEINKLNKSLLQQPNCTWAYLGNGKDGQEADRYLFWTSLNTDKVGAGKEIPVIIQTGDGKYYVSETKTGKRKGKKYVTISESLTTQSQYKEILNKGKEFSSLEKAYDAYLKALGDSKYDSVRQSQS
ncbi:prepilin-type N-terminal cleavage/methylation domain-containing protein [Hominenteromicrobium sp.]|jgi:prepilin-type cleavage/methylation N-terminal domain protein|uniref:prepilin-type N-terminal cleavage/methylation domain-containing protein n=1 Tax=Hominenteromicrobium sp. TaxID=3073581 RepID=UPI00399B2EE7